MVPVAHAAIIASVVTVEIVSTMECGLCDEAHRLLVRLKKEFLFDLTVTQLTEEHPRFAEWHIAVPVVIINSRRELLGVIKEDDLRRIIHEELPPTPLYYAGKFLEAIGFLALAVGLFYGFMGDMWADLYLFLGGMVIFAVGRTIERGQLRRNVDGGSVPSTRTS